MIDDKNKFSDVNISSELNSPNHIMNFKLDSSSKEITIENNSNFYKNKDNNLDCLVKINSNLSLKVPKFQLGLCYRHDQLNGLVNLNYTHAQSDPSLINYKTQENKVKLGFIKKNSFEGIDAFYGARVNYIFQSSGNNLNFNNVKASAGLIHKDYALFVSTTKTKNSVFPDKYQINGVIKLLPKINLFGEFKKCKDKYNTNITSTSFGYQWELKNNSEFKMKLVSNERKCYFALKRNLNKNLEVNFIGSLGLKDPSSENLGSLESNMGFNITYTE